MPDSLADRIRAALPADRVSERRMFGVHCFMVDDALAIGVRKDGGLLVRVDRDDDPALLRRPGAARAQMGPGRSMGLGWIEVAPEVLVGEAALVEWVGAALRHRG